MLFPFSFMKTVPVAPVATAATGVGETSFTANWNAFTGATYYLLDVSTSPSFSSFVLQDEFTTSTSYVVIGLTASTTYYYRVRANVGVDPDAQAFFDRVTTAGGTLSATEQTATNQLVLDMKAAGIWTKMKAVYPMVGASAAACAQNLVSSSFTGTFTSGWTFASTGVTGNGTSAYINTNFNPNTSSNANSKHISYYSRNNFDFCQIGISSSGYDQIYYVGGAYYNILSTTSWTPITTATTKGFVLASRTTSVGGTTTYVNNSNLGNDGLTSTTNPIGNLYINARNEVPSVGGFSPNQCAFASIGDGLTSTQASNFYTAVQTFNQTLSRSVGPQIVSDADAQAYINRVYTAGGTLTNTEANAVNQLTIDMKAAGIWTAMKAVYPMVGASAAACAQNLKSSSFTGSFTSGWTFSSTGVTPNGTSAYMDTNFNPNTSLTSILSAHIGIYSRTQSRGGCDVSVNQGGAELTIAADLNLIGIYGLSNIGTQYAGNFSTNTSVGFFLANRQSATNNKIIQGTTTLATQTTSSGTTKPNVNVFVGGQNNNGSFGLPTTRQQAFVSIGDGLTDTQAADFYTCVNTFQVSLSRNV